MYSPRFHSSIADTFDYNVVEALSITSNRTDANVVYLTAGSKKTPMCKRAVKDRPYSLGDELDWSEPCGILH